MTHSKDIAPSEDDTQGTGLYLYGIGKASASPADLGDSRSPGEIFRLDIGNLAAFVRTVPLSEYSEEALTSRLQDHEWLIEAARDHHAAVARIHETVSILPAKFGTIYSTEEDLRKSLSSSPDVILGRLDEVDGCDEWALHIYRQGDSIRERALAEDPELQRLCEQLENASSGRSYLLQRQIQSRLNDAIEAQENAITEQVLGEIHARTRSIHLEPPKESSASEPGEFEIARASMLVRREQVDDFLNAVDHISESTSGIRVEITGPWPAYSFAQIDEKE